MIQDIGAIVGFLFVAWFAYLFTIAIREDPAGSFKEIKGCVVPVLAAFGALVVMFWLLDP